MRLLAFGPPTRPVIYPSQRTLFAAALSSLGAALFRLGGSVRWFFLAAPPLVVG